MNIAILIIVFIFGLVFGSFYNVVGLRLSKNESIAYPPSHCTSCNHKLKVLDLVPVISFIFLKGRCRYCNSKISGIYPITELITGILFALSYYVFGFSYDFIISILLSSLFSIIFVTDFNFYIIPDEINIIFPIIIFIVNILRLGIKLALIYLGYSVLIFTFMYLLMLLGNFVFKKESLGGGDIKLMLSLGSVLPIMSSMFSIFLSAFLALPISIIMYIKNKNKVIPFGPFLVIAFLITFMLKINVIQFLN